MLNVLYYISVINYVMSSDNLTDSPDGPACSICFVKLDDVPYALINDEGEKGRYHVHCLEKWIQKGTRGIMLDKKINSYSIYHMDKLIETIVNNKPIIPDNNNQIIPIDDNNQPVPDNTSETTILIPSNDNDTESSDSGNEYSCYAQLNRGRIMCVGIALLVIVGIVIFSYVFMHK